MAGRDERWTLLLQKEKSTSVYRLLFCDSVTLTVVLTQISFLVFAWTFAGFMFRSIQLSDSRAAWIQNNPSDTQLIVTLVSIIIALISSFCLSKIVQYALVRRLAWGPLPLSTMTEWAKLAQRTISLNADGRKWSWTLFSVAWISLLGFLTTAWVTLLAPQNIVLHQAIQIKQANFLHPSVSSLLADVLTSSPQPPPGFNLTPTRTLNYSGIFLESGGIDLARNLVEAGVSAAAVNAALVNFPSPTTNLIGIPGTEYVSNSSTGGIFFPVDIFPGIYENYQIYSSLSVDSYNGLTRSLSMTQQGFTANVSCGWTDVPVVTSTIMNSVQLVVDGDSGDTWIQDTYSWSATCSPGVAYSTYGVTVVGNMPQDLPPDDNLLMASVCFGQDFNGLSNQSFLVLLRANPDSRYADFAQTCEVTPLVTTVQVTYAAGGVANITQPPLEQHPLPAPTDTYNSSVLLWFPTYVLWTTLVGSQGLDGNEFGDSLLALQLNRAILIESYLRGMVEYLGSILNAIAAQTDNIPADMIIQSNGKLHLQTFGWSFHLRTHGPSLAAITLVALLTVALGVFTMLPIPPRHNATPTRGDAWKPPVHGFNPTVTMDVLLASTAGDLSRVLTESGAAYHLGVGVGVGKRDEDGAGAGEGARGMRKRLGVMLERTSEGWPALRTVNLNSVTEDRAGVGLDCLHFLRDRRGGRASVDDVQRDEYIELGMVPRERTTEL